MGVDLIGNGGFSMNWSAWHHIQDLAQEFGWSPRGVVPPDDHPDKTLFNGRDGYNSNDGQLATDTDAGALGTALGRAIEDPLDPIAASHVNFDEQQRPTLEELSAEMKRFIENPELLKNLEAAEDKLPLWLVAEFAAYCKRGGFRIY